jgi:uroporphyrinogen III methyltransferase/synthase
MAEGLPLAGKRVVVTRAAEQAGGLAAELERLGAEVLYLPVVRYEEPRDTKPLDSALNRLAQFDWLVVTSQNVVRFVSGRLQRLKKSGDARFPKVATVGPATAEAAQEAGWPVEFVANRFQGAALAEELGERLRGCKVLLPRSDRASAELPDALRKVGADVTEVVAYRTLPADFQGSAVVEEMCAGKVDAITFASPSAYRALADAMGEERMRGLAKVVAIAAIGPVTAQAIREAGMPVHVEAEEFTAGGLAQGVLSYFVRHQAALGARMP